MNKKTKKQNGQALIEALLALTIVIVIITAVVTAVIHALSNTTFTKNQNLATQYAQEAMDIARNMRDTDYAGFKELNSSDEYYCPNNEGILEEEACPQDGNFQTMIYIKHDPNPGDGIGVTDESGLGIPKCEDGSSFVSSLIKWTDSKCTGGSFCHDVKLDQCFSDPNQTL